MTARATFTEAEIARAIRAAGKAVGLTQCAVEEVRSNSELQISCIKEGGNMNWFETRCIVQESLP